MVKYTFIKSLLWVFSGLLMLVLIKHGGRMWMASWPLNDLPESHYWLSGFGIILALACSFYGVTLILGTPTRSQRLLGIGSLLLSLCLAEIGFRHAGYQPGLTQREIPFNISLPFEVFHDYQTNEQGIQSFNPSFFHRHTDSWKRCPDPSFQAASPEALQVMEEFSQHRQYIQNIINKGAYCDCTHVQALMEYARNPVNSAGFRSLPFDTTHSCANRILLLGDSFTWGMLARPLFLSFADQLLGYGWMVYNTGIIATDPLQYRQVNDYFLDSIRPDHVIVNLFAGNDLTEFPRDIQPFLPIFYSTSAGRMSNHPHGKYLKSPRKALELSLAEYQVPASENIFNKLASKWVLTTLLWKALFRGWHMDILNVKQYQYYTYEAGRKVLPSPWKSWLQEIDIRCKQAKIPCTVVVIPARGQNPDPLQKLIQPYVTAKVHVFPSDLIDYDPLDGHFNASGHQRYADFIHQLLSSKKP